MLDCVLFVAFTSEKMPDFMFNHLHADNRSLFFTLHTLYMFIPIHVYYNNSLRTIVLQRIIQQ